MPIQKITSGVIDSIANTQISGTITASQIATVNANTITSGSIPLAQVPQLTGVKMPVGSVLQVVSATYSTQASIGVNTFTNSGLTVSITPTSLSSKIYIVASFMVYVPGGRNLKSTILRGSTNLGDATYGMATTYSSSSGIQDSATLNYLDSPATSSSITYNVAIAAELGAAYICYNGEKASITVMEIAG
jgi:hypothetical protein